MLGKFQNLVRKIAESHEFISDARVKSYFNFELGRTELATQFLHQILHQGYYFPITSPTLNNFSLLQVVNDIVVNNRKCYVEFGSGLSTIALARLKKQNQLSIELVSVESDEGWIQFIHKVLKQEGLSDLVHMVYAPLVPQSTYIFKTNNDWYATEPILNILSTLPKPDCVLVDGPAAYNEKIKYSRYPALPFMNSLLHDSFTFFLDDINRAGELEILEDWSKKLQVEQVKLSATFGVLHRNLGFYPFYQ